MEDMAQEFGDMLKETLDRMRERIEVSPACKLVAFFRGGTPRSTVSLETSGRAVGHVFRRDRHCREGICSSTPTVSLHARQLKARKLSRGSLNSLVFPSPTWSGKLQVNSTGFDADDSIPLQRRLEEVSLATLAEAPHK